MTAAAVIALAALVAAAIGYPATVIAEHLHELRHDLRRDGWFPHDQGGRW